MEPLFVYHNDIPLISGFFVVVVGKGILHDRTGKLLVGEFVLAIDEACFQRVPGSIKYVK